MKLQRFRILTGEHAGKIVDAYDAWVRPRIPCPESEVDMRLNAGIWVPSLNIRIAGTKDEKGKYNEYEDLVVPFDRYNNEIKVGSIVFYAARDLDVRKMEIVKLGDVFHAGCGWYQRTIHGKDLDTQKMTKNSYPSRCIVCS